MVFIKTLCAAIVLSSALVAASGSFNAIIPCGGGKDTARHAIVPDKSCQQIDPSGSTDSFSVVEYAKSENVKVAFSASPDCEKVFVPSAEQISALQSDGVCVTLRSEDDSQPLRYVMLVTDE